MSVYRARFILAWTASVLLALAGCQTAHPDYDLDSTPGHAGESYQGVE